MEQRGYILRHGCTEGNTLGLSRGLTDIPLTSLGMSQGSLDGRELKKYDVKSLRASKIERTRHFAKLVGREIGIKPVLTDRLDTLDIGDLTKKPDSEIQSTIAKHMLERPDALFPGGRDSFNSWLHYIWPEIHLFFLLIKNGNTPAIVTHGRVCTVIDALTKGDCKFLDKEVLKREPEQQPGEIYAVIWDGEKFRYEFLFNPTPKFGR